MMFNLALKFLDFLTAELGIHTKDSSFFTISKIHLFKNLKLYRKFKKYAFFVAS